jgi:hypothetical protein
LLPPKWEPASVAKTQQFKNSSGTSKNLHVKLGNDQNIKSKAVDKKKSPKSKKAALLVSFSDAIKPTEHGEYMPSDDPADIANIRRSLIAQEFPGSTLAETPQAYLRQANPGSEPFSDDLVGQEEEEAHHTGELDDLEASVPNLAVPEAGNRNLNPSASTATTLSGEERHVHHLFNRQHRKYFTRKLDHSEFTSEEDLPYQGDSDLSLPLEILFRLALYVNQAKADGKIETPLVSVVTNSLDSLANSLTAFERIVHTPIPKAYNIHLQVFFFFFMYPIWVN